MRVPRWLVLAAAAALIAALAAAGGLVATGSSAVAPKAQKQEFLAALISDVGRFNDKSFNQFQLEGLKRAQTQLGVRILPLESRSASDYIPNLTTAIRRKADMVVAAGFLLASATNTVAKKFPDTQFAITDYSVSVPPFKKNKNVTGLTYAAHESGCLVGVLAALMTRRQGGRQIIGAVGGIKIPPVDIWIAGYRHCAKLVNPRITVLIGYSQDFVAADKCKTVAENQIARGARVLFQVAGQCGLGTLAAADEARIWGIGVDKDQFKEAKRVLTSGVKRVDVGVFLAVKAAKEGSPLGGTDLTFNLKNGGMSVGRISPSVPKAFVDRMNDFKRRIIAGTLKVPSSL